MKLQWTQSHIRKLATNIFSTIYDTYEENVLPCNRMRSYISFFFSTQILVFFELSHKQLRLIYSFNILMQTRYQQKLLSKLCFRSHSKCNVCWFISVFFYHLRFLFSLSKSPLNSKSMHELYHLHPKVSFPRDHRNQFFVMV